MNEEARRYIRAARVPLSLTPQCFGPWRISRNYLTRVKKDSPAFWEMLRRIGFDSQTILSRHTWATMHLDIGDVVMEDSIEELRKHLPIWMESYGRVLVTGLGLGCVVRGLLANPRVIKVTVLEIDRGIIRVVGREFENDRRVKIIETDALRFQPKRSDHWDFAWHDLWTDGDTHLQLLHAQLFAKFRKHSKIQGAWGFPRLHKRLIQRHGTLRMLG